MDLVITADHRDMLSIELEVLLKIVVITIVFTVLLSCIVILLVRRIVRPLKTLTNAAEKIVRNDYNIDFSPSNAI
jgi:nitrate/nitrite-specific signal transduction histidine kinase